VKKTFFFMAGIAVGLCTSLVAAQGAGLVAVLNTSGVYIELVTLVPGQGTGQHSGIPGEVGIVAGHIAAVCVAHWIALREYPSRREALWSQLPMLGLMVGYTVLSLWIIAQPIVETSPKG